MCGRYVISKPVSKTVDLVKTNIKVEDADNFNNKQFRITKNDYTKLL